MAKSTTKYSEALRKMREPNPNLEEVFKILLSASLDGDHRASSAIATWYYYGRYVKRNFRKAVHFARKAVGEGSVEGLHYLAVSFERGEGVKKDESEAFNFYVSAALLGDKQAMYEVGRMLYYGLGTTRDRTLAKLWYQKSGISRHSRSYRPPRHTKFQPHVRIETIAKQ